ncbi:hypothetical protein [Hymenobacter nivis]|uniref:Uncharacterized protein n=1 Tax=Hymenobacter nivis TaxID=1850093 RepID=A0A502GL70_9BACT|nr:hypothetical protein [Hymenobacter nivis]TPG62889.1 hypothetical protein EAH73_17635 [Hymenobacter nivis]
MHQHSPFLAVASFTLACGLLSCRHDPDPSPVPELPQAQFHADLAKSGSSAAGFFVLSSRPVRQANGPDDRLNTLVLRQPANGVADFTFAREIFPDTLYVSLSYQNVQGLDNNGIAFKPPVASDSVRVTLTLDQRPPITLRINAATLQNPATRWTDDKGVVNSSVETYILR